MNIRSIAEMCGVSPSTVSRILNNRPDVSAETREMVIQAMNRGGYTPLVRANNSRTIGIVTPNSLFAEFMGQIMSGLMETAYSFGSKLMLLSIDDRDLRNASDSSHFCRVNGLSGMIVVAPSLDSRLPARLLESNVPHVVVASTYRESEICWVDVDNVGGVRATWKSLRRTVYRLILPISAPSTWTPPTALP